MRNRRTSIKVRPVVIEITLPNMMMMIVSMFIFYSDPPLAKQKGLKSGTLTTSSHFDGN